MAPVSAAAGSESHAQAAAPSKDPRASRSTRASRGCKGRRCMSWPRGVTRPPSVAPNRARRARALCRRSSDGRSNQSKVDGSAPQARTESSGPERSMRWISGSRCGRSRSRASQSRTTTPGPRRAARPARWSALSSVTRSVVRLSTPRSGVVARHLLEARVDHRRDAGHREGRLSDVRGEDDPATPGRPRQRRILRVRVQGAVERHEVHAVPCGHGLALARRPGNLARAGQEAEHVAARRTEPPVERGGDWLPGGVVDLERVQGPRNIDHRASAKEARHRSPCRASPTSRGCAGPAVRARPAWPSRAPGRRGRCARGIRRSPRW